MKCKQPHVGYFLSSTPRPHFGKTSPVQKGLIPSLHDGEADLCEEGVGIGVPVLQYRRDFFFPGSADVSVDGRIERAGWKRFNLDLVERYQSEGTNSMKNHTWIVQRIYNRLYKSSLTRKIIKNMQASFPRLHYLDRFYRSSFFKVRSQGHVKTRYEISESGKINVSLDLSELNRSGLQQIYISNELGGRVFDRYMDSTGAALAGSEIGEWVEVSASWVSFQSEKSGLDFRVEIPEEVVAFRGREIIHPDIYWSGVVFMLPRETTELSYRIGLGPMHDIGEGNRVD
ncbi:MAG: hypothetical protein ACE5H4_00035 [Candidatus Thorarchaeota archaeon]